MAALLAAAEHAYRRLRIADARVAALSDAAGAELLPLEGAVGAVVLLEHPAERATRSIELCVIARPQAGGQVVRIDHQREADEVVERADLADLADLHGHQDRHEELGGGEGDLLGRPVPIDDDPKVGRDTP